MARFRRAQPSWPELRDALPAILDAAFPAAGTAAVTFERSGPDEPAEVWWQDGPARAAVAAALGDLDALDGWVLVLDDDPVPSRPKGAVLRLRRSFSAAALAVAVVRFQASHPRPYSSRREGQQADFAALLDVDHPARSGYPVADAMADLLLAAPDPPADAEPADGPPVDEADRLSWRLQWAGYDALWATAWSSIA